MFARVIFSIAIVIEISGTALGDMGPPPGLKRAKTINRITSAMELREHVVVLVQRPLPFGTPEEQKRTAEFAKLPLDVTGHYRASAELLLVPRSVAEEFRTATALAEAAKTHSEIERFSLHFNEDVPAWYGTEFVVNHRLDRNAATGKFELVRTSWQPYKQCCVVLLAIPLAFIYLGYRMIRWLLRGVNKRNPSTPPTEQP